MTKAWFDNNGLDGRRFESFLEFFGMSTENLMVGCTLWKGINLNPSMCSCMRGSIVVTTFVCMNRICAWPNQRRNEEMFSLLDSVEPHCRSILGITNLVIGHPSFLCYMMKSEGAIFLQDKTET